MNNHLYDSLPECEKLVSCPYNRAHQVVSKRLPNHLIKCRRSHGGEGFRTCIFDVSHVFPLGEIESHQKTCPGRLTVELGLAGDSLRRTVSSIDSGMMSMVSSTSTVLGASAAEYDHGNWDGPPVPSYDPMKKVMKSDIIRNIQHLTPSERKEAREQEHARLQEIRCKQPPSESN